MNFTQSRFILILLLSSAVIFIASPAGFCQEGPAQQAPRQRERDPMMPQEMSIFERARPAAPARRAERSTFQVHGVGRGPRGAYAIINGQAYAEGETKGTITVVKIGETTVDILSDGIAESLPIKKR